MLWCAAEEAGSGPGEGDPIPWHTPYAEVTTNQSGNLWCTLQGSNAVGHLDPRTSGGIVLRHMVFDAKTRSIWFGSDANTIGRVALGPVEGERSHTL